jgi:hypothetical protein
MLPNYQLVYHVRSSGPVQRIICTMSNVQPGPVLFYTIHNPFVAHTL